MGQRGGHAAGPGHVEYRPSGFGLDDGRVVAHAGRHQHGQAAGPVFANFDSRAKQPAGRGPNGCEREVGRREVIGHFGVRGLGHKRLPGTQAHGGQLAAHVGLGLGREHDETETRPEMVGGGPKQLKGFVVVVNIAKLAHVDAHHCLGAGVAQALAHALAGSGIESKSGGIDRAGHCHDAVGRHPLTDKLLPVVFGHRHQTQGQLLLARFPVPLEQVAGVVGFPHPRLAHVVGVRLERLDVERQLGFLPHQVGQRPGRRPPADDKVGPKLGGLPNQLLRETGKILHFIEDDVAARLRAQRLKRDFGRGEARRERERGLGFGPPLDGDEADGCYVGALLEQA